MNDPKSLDQYLHSKKILGTMKLFFVGRILPIMTFIGYFQYILTLCIKKNLLSFQRLLKNKMLEEFNGSCCNYGDKRMAYVLE